MSSRSPRVLLRPRWLAFHVLALAVTAACLALGWWQIRRAGQGNLLSWAYAFEWPVFAAFTVFVWSRVLRDHVRPPAEAPAAVEARVPVLPVRPAAPAEAADPELAAYNRYLAELAKNEES